MSDDQPQGDAGQSRQPEYPQYPGYPGADQPSAGQNPTHGQGQYGQDQYGQAPYGQSPYGQQPSYGQAPSAYGQQAPQWQPIPQPYGPYAYGPYAGLPVAPKHPSAVTALVLGIVGVAGVVLCGLGTVVAPFAWYLGQKATSEIDQNPGAYSGRGESNAGKVLGIIGTVLLVLVVLFWGLVLGVGISDPDAFD